MSVERSSTKPVLAFLLINEFRYLPKIAITSALTVTDSLIYIGFIDHKHLKGIPEDARIRLIDLSDEAKQLDIGMMDMMYQPYTTDNFFKLVQLKWPLMRRILTAYPNANLIYVDLDVVWVSNPIDDLALLFQQNQDLQFAIQNSSTNPSETSLCMGFLYLRNSSETLQGLDWLARDHARVLRDNPRQGDDYIISQFYRSPGNAKNFYLLPQITFPTGNLLNLFSKSDVFIGLKTPLPYIFHANYVTGELKKALLLYFISRRFRKHFNSIKLYEKIYFYFLFKVQRYGSLTKKLYRLLLNN
jgi:hypothetical protein